MKRGNVTPLRRFVVVLTYLVSSFVDAIVLSFQGIHVCGLWQLHGGIRDRCHVLRFPHPLSQGRSAGVCYRRMYVWKRTDHDGVQRIRYIIISNNTFIVISIIIIIAIGIVIVIDILIIIVFINNNFDVFNTDDAFDQNIRKRTLTSYVNVCLWILNLENCLIKVIVLVHGPWPLQAHLTRHEDSQTCMLKRWNCMVHYYIPNCKRPITLHHSHHVTVHYHTVQYGCYWTVVIAQLQLTSHVKSTIKAVDREKYPNEVLVHFVWSFVNRIRA